MIKFKSNIAEDSESIKNNLVISKQLKQIFEDILISSSSLFRNSNVDKHANNTEIKRISEMAHNGRELLTTLEHIENIRKNHTVFNQNTISLDIVLKEKLRILDSRISQKGIILESEIDNNLELEIDFYIVNFIVSSLLQNAIRNSLTGSSVQISCKLLENIIEFTVIDDGVGMFPENIKEIFEDDDSNRYDLVGQKNSLKTQLKICKNYIKEFNGDFSIGSKIGEGSKITVLFPVANSK